MHDGGGNRERTVEALPLIIDGARARGFTFVPIYQLMGKTKADVMPPLPTNEYWSARLNAIAFWLASAVMTAITLIFFLGDILMTGRLISIGVLAIYDRLRAHVYGTPEQIAAYRPMVAVLIPAFNEEKVIERTVQGALDSDYPNLRVIVIDDGSKDRTLEIVRRTFAAEEANGRVVILTKTNGGKAEALNYGLEHIGAAEIFVGIDADTIIAPDAIVRMVPHFLNPKVGAVAGNAKVGNRVNLWTRWQALEYITSQNFERRALNTMGAVSVVPGAIGAWRVEAVGEAGGYHVDTVAEDADLTMALLRNGYRVEYEDMALAFTEASDQCERSYAAKISLVIRNPASHLQTQRRLRPQRRIGMGCASEHPHISDFITAGIAPHRRDVRSWSHLVFHSEIFPSRIERSRQFPAPADFLRSVPDHRFHCVNNCLRPRAPPARSPRRRMAAQSSLVTALRLSPGIFVGFIPHPEAGHPGPSICLGQTRSNRRR